MLVLTRHVGETIVIRLPNEQRVQVRVLSVKGGQVRIGTDAPEEVTIVRAELT